MTTLSALKTRIIDDIDGRTDLNTQIGEAIADAINHYKPVRFFFNETRSATFVTVAAQSTYTSSDDADIPLFVELDAVYLNDGTNNLILRREHPDVMEELLDSAASSGEPYAYSYFEDSFRLYPVPDAVYTIRPMGIIEKAAPATDDETGNVWMTKAFELIRCRAKAYLAVHVLKDEGLLRLMVAAESEALTKLRKHSNKQAGTGRIVPTQF